MCEIGHCDMNTLALVHVWMGQSTGVSSSPLLGRYICDLQPECIEPESGKPVQCVPAIDST